MMQIVDSHRLHVRGNKPIMQKNVWYGAKFMCVCVYSYRYNISVQAITAVGTALSEPISRMTRKAGMNYGKRNIRSNFRPLHNLIH